MSAKVGDVIVKMTSQFCSTLNVCMKSLVDEATKWRKRAKLSGISGTVCTLAGAAFGTIVMALGTQGGFSAGIALSFATLATTPAGWVALGVIGLGIILLFAAFICESMSQHYLEESIKYYVKNYNKYCRKL